MSTVKKTYTETRTVYDGDKFKVMSAWRGIRADVKVRAELYPLDESDSEETELPAEKTGIALNHKGRNFEADVAATDFFEAFENGVFRKIS